MSQELNRNFSALKEKADPPPYFLSYEITEQEFRSVAGTLGTVDSSTGGKSRALDVSVRVGTPKLDNYHRVRGDRGQFTSGALVSFEDNVNSIKRRLVAGDRSRLSHRGGAPHPHQDQHPGQGGRGGRFRRFLHGIPVQLRAGPRQTQIHRGRVAGEDPQVLRPLPELPERAHLARLRALPDRHALPGELRRLARRPRARLRARGHQRRGQGRRRHRPQLVRNLRSRG